MTTEEARAYLNYLLTQSIRQEESFGPLALAFIRENDLDKLGLLPEEQFSLYMATAQVLTVEPKRSQLKIELLEKAKNLLSQTSYFHPQLEQQLEYDIKKTKAEQAIYNEAMAVPKSRGGIKQEILVQSDAPEYYLDTAQRRASEYYQNKYGLSKEAKTAQSFGGTPRQFEPENKDIQKEFPGACGPFMNARTNAFHMMLPFDLKISRKPEAPLEASVRVFYTKMGYSFPLSFEMGRFCSLNDGKVLDIAQDDPNLLYVSASAVKEPEFRFDNPAMSSDVPREYVYPMTVLERTGTLGPYVQVVSNFKIWFDASTVSILIQGSPDLYEYGAQGGSGLMTRSHAADKIDAYADALTHPWQEGLSFNFVNLHLTLSPGNDTALIPYNTPIFTIYPVLNKSHYKWQSTPE